MIITLTNQVQTKISNGRVFSSYHDPHPPLISTTSRSGRTGKALNLWAVRQAFKGGQLKIGDQTVGKK